MQEGSLPSISESTITSRSQSTLTSSLTTTNQSQSNTSTTTTKPIANTVHNNVHSKSPKETNSQLSQNDRVLMKHCKKVLKAIFKHNCGSLDNPMTQAQFRDSIAMLGLLHLNYNSNHNDHQYMINHMWNIITQFEIITKHTTSTKSTKTISFDTFKTYAL